jgi:hypothetical protein
MNIQLDGCEKKLHAPINPARNNRSSDGAVIDVNALKDNVKKRTLGHVSARRFSQDCVTNEPLCGATLPGLLDPVERSARCSRSHFVSAHRRAVRINGPSLRIARTEILSGT